MADDILRAGENLGENLTLATGGAHDATSIEVGADGAVHLPTGFNFGTAEFSKAGPDLVMTAPDGRQVVVEDYFASENPPKLQSPQGGELEGATAARLAAANTPAQFAQAAPAGAEQPIGQVQTITGTVTAIRADGTKVELSEGDPVFQGDIIQSGPNGALGIVLADETTFSMAENGRMVLDEMVYDPSTQEGNISMSVLQGVFTFVSGQVAKVDPDAMALKTPVATIGIRGTQVGINLGEEGGEPKLDVVLMEERDGFVGEVVISNNAGLQILNLPDQATRITRIDVPPAEPQVLPRVEIRESYGQSLDHLPQNVGTGNNYQQRADVQHTGNDADVAQFETASGGAQVPAEDLGTVRQDGPNGEEGSRGDGLVGIEVAGSGNQNFGGNDTSAFNVTQPLSEDVGTTNTPTTDTTTTTPPTTDNNGPADTGSRGTGAGNTTSRPEETPVNRAPAAGNDQAAVQEDHSVTIAVKGNDSDADNDAVIIASTTNPQHGTIVINSDGTITYTPADNYSGSDSFTYTISDGNGGTSTATVSLTVNPENDTPVAVADSFILNEDAALTIEPADLLGNDSDIDNDTLTILSVQDATHGTVQLVDGKPVFTPAAEFNGEATFTYTISDGNGGTSTAMVTLRVDPANDAPVAVADSFTLNEDASLTIEPADLLGNDGDIDGDTLSILSVQDATHGTVSLDQSGNVVFTPDANYNGPAQFTYTISDGNGGTSTAVVNLTLNPQNDAPVAVADSFTLNEDAALTIEPTDLLGNDSDLDNDTLTILSVQDATHGTVQLVDGKPVFTPAADFNGEATFTYTISDGNGGTSTAVVTLRVDPANDAPVAVADSFTLNEDAALTIEPAGLLGNDSDLDNDALTILSVQDATHGTVSLDQDGNVVFTPDANYNGPAQFTYTISDGNGGTSTAVVNLTLNPTNDAPVAVEDSFVLNEDSALSLNPAQLLGNDNDIDGDTLSILSVQDATHGTVSLDQSGNVVFTPDANYNGPAQFTYTISDGNGGTSTAVVNLTLNPTNDAPVAVEDSFVLNEDSALSLNPAQLLGNDSDLDNDALTILSVQDATHGTVTLDQDGNVVFAPDANYNGPASFTYTISDGNGGTSTAMVNLTLNPTNDAPVAVADSFTLDEDNALNLSSAQLLTGQNQDHDIDGDTITIVSVQDATHGTVSLDQDGNVVFTPDANYNGPAQFTYTISDGNGGTSTAVVNLTLNPQNDAPVAVSDSFTLNEDNALNLSSAQLLGNDSDIDNDTLTILSVQDATHGTVTLDQDGNVVFTPDANYNGPAQFTYTISDGNGGTSTAVVNLTLDPQNDAPVAVEDSFVLNEDSALSLNPAQLLGNDNDIDNDTLSILSVQDATHGTVSLDQDGNVVFTPDANYNGPASFTYTISDGNGDTSTAVVNLTLNPTNDAPVAVADSFTLNEDAALTIEPADLLGNDGDIDGDTLSILSVQDATHGTVQLVDGKPVFTPAADFNGEATFTYTISDGNGGTSTAVVNLTVNPQNDAPVAVADAFILNEDSALTIEPAQLLGNDSDIDNDTLTILSVQDATHGTVSLDQDGNVVFTPDANYNGPAQFTYTISDGNGGTSTAVVNLTLNPTNDAPVAVSDSFTLNEDAALNLNPVQLLGNDSDLDNDTLTILSVQDATHGTVSLDQSGNVVFTPDANYNGPAQFTYTISDGNGGTSTAVVTLRVDPANDAPVAVADSFTLNEDVALTIEPAGLLGNDSDLDNDTLTILSVQDATHGTVSLDQDGNVVFTPADNYNGPASFTYTISDGNGGTSTATVNLTVDPQNDDPVAVNDIVAAVEDTPILIDPANLLRNDSDIDGDVLTVTDVGSAVGGTVSLVDGKIQFVPAPDFSGEASFSYTVSDSQGGTSTATTTVAVAAVADAPTLTVTVAEIPGSSQPEDLFPTMPHDLSNVVLYVNNGGEIIKVKIDDISGGGRDADQYPLHNFVEAHYPGAELVAVAIKAGNNWPGVPTHKGEGQLFILDNDATASSLPLSANYDDTYPFNTAFNGIDPVPGGNGTTFAVNIDTDLTDADGSETLSIVLGNIPAGVTFSAGVNNGDGTWTLTPAQLNGLTMNVSAGVPDDFSFSVTSTSTEASNQDSASVSLNVGVGVNVGPDANNDVGALDEDAALTMNILANDTDGDGDAVYVGSVTQPAHGTVTINDDGTVTYTPHANYNGADSFTYTIYDGQGGSSTASVALTVNPVNDAPVAVTDTFALNEDNALNLNPAQLLTGENQDHDIDGDPLTITSVQDATHGHVEIVNGQVVFTPEANYAGQASFTYTISDGQGGTSTAVVNLTVNPVNDAPVAVNDTGTLDEDADITINVLANDTDTDNATLSVSSVTQPAHGTVAINDDGTVTYTPIANYNGADSFTYVVTDPSGATSTATVNLTVNPLNDVPVAVNDSYALDEDNAATLDVLGNDTNPDGGLLTISQLNQPAHGTVTLNTDGTVTYTPATNYNGADSFTYIVTDASGDTSLATVSLTVNPQNDVPVAFNDSKTLDEDSSAIIDVLGNDVNPDDGALTVTQVNPPAHGSVTLNTDGTVTYTPEADYNGADSFTYIVTDASGDTSLATVSLTVNPQNDAPVAVDDTFVLNEDNALNLSPAQLLGNDGDVDGDTLSILSVQDATHGTVTLDQDGNVVFTPDADYNGPASFTYTISDGNGGTSTAVVNLTLNPQNDAPVAVNDSFTLNEDNALNLSSAQLLGNDSDIDNDTLTILSVQDATHGTVTLDQDGNVVFTPDADYNGPASFTYTISDGNGGTSTAVVNLTLNPQNDAPVAVNDSFTLNEDNALNLSSAQLLGNDSDIDNDTLTILSVQDATHGTVSLDQDGNVVFTPDADYNGPAQFTYTISDGNGGTSTAVVNLTLNPQNDAPVAVDDTFVLNEDNAAVINLKGNDTDVDDTNAQLIVDSFTQPAHGTVTLNDDGTVTYTPAADYTGADSFTYTITDPSGSTSTATVSLTVNPQNDAPVVQSSPVFFMNEDGTITISTAQFLQGASDIDSAVLNITAPTVPAEQGTITGPDEQGNYTFTPAANFAGAVTLSYNVTDGAASVAQHTTVNIAAVADAPALTVTVGAGTAVGGATADTTLGIDVNPTQYTDPASFQQTGTNAGDSIAGGAGNNTIAGSDGNDSLFGDDSYETENAGNDTINAGDGKDFVAGGKGDDQISGGDGDDTIDGDFDWDTAGGNDIISGGDGKDNIDGGRGADHIMGGNDADTINGDFGWETEGGNDVIDAGSGNDTVVGGRGDDLIAGGDGNDRLVGDFEWETAGGNDQISGGAGNDTIIGGVGNDKLAGGDGNDVIYGDYTYNTNGDGNDIIAGGKGNDKIYGGGGNDVAVFAGTRDQYQITQNGDGSFKIRDLVVGRDGEDKVYDVETFRFADGDVSSSDLLSGGGGGVSTGSGIQYPLNIAAALTDTDGSESLSTIRIDMSTIPAGTIFSAGTLSGNTWMLTPAQLSGLTMTVPTNTPAFNLNVSVTSTEASNGDAKTTTVSIGVGTTNQGPVAVADSAATNEDGAVTFAPLANDTDANGDALTITSASLPSDVDASVTINSDGTLTFAPGPSYNAMAAGETATVAVTYTVSDGHGGTSTAVATVTVTGTNDGPVAIDSSFTLNEDNPLIIAPSTLFGDVTDIDSPTSGFSIIGVGDATHGTVQIVDGQVKFVPEADYAGEASFTYTVSDGNGGTAAATVNLTIDPQGDLSLVASNVTAQEDVPINLGLSSSSIVISDTDGSESADAIKLTFANLPQGAVVNGATWSAAAGAYLVTSAAALSNVTVIPPAGWNGQFTTTLTVTTNEGGAQSQNFTVTANPVNDAPIVTSSPAFTVNEDTAIIITKAQLLAGASDADGDTLSVQNLMVPANQGTLSGPDANGDYVFTPAADFSGSLSLSYKVSDGAAAVNQTASVAVTPDADAPDLSATVAIDHIVPTATAIPFSATLLEQIQAGHTVTISGVPDGAMLSAGTHNADGTWTLTGAQVHAGVTITPSGASDADFDLGVTVTNPSGGSQTLINASFNSGWNGFGYVDDAFDTNQTGKARNLEDGERTSHGGYGYSGGLVMELGNDDSGQSVSNMSAGFTTTVHANAAGDGSITFKYKMDRPSDFEHNEYAEIRVAIDGELVTFNGHDYIMRDYGSTDTGWVTVTVPLGDLSAGSHEVTIGGFQNARTESDEVTTIAFDDISMTISGGSTNVATASMNFAPSATSKVYDVNIAAALNDTDGSEVLSITVGDVPAGATLSAGIKNPDGTWTLTPAQLDNLEMTVPGSVVGDFSLSVVATSTETANGDMASTTVSATVTVPVIDTTASAPTVTVSAASGLEDEAIALDIAAALTDTDGSESLAITISGVPDGAMLSAGTLNADGTWTLTPAQLSGLTVTGAPDSDDDFTLAVTATSTESDGGATAVTTKTMAVHVGAVADLPELSATLGAPSIVTTGGSTTNVTIASSNVMSTNNGFTVTASMLNRDGSLSEASSSNIAIHTSSPAGFGVSGASSGDDEEIGRASNRGSSEQLNVQFGNDVSSAKVTFAWLSTSEQASYKLYDNGVLVGSGTITGRTDNIDPAVTLRADNNVPFDKIVFTAPGADDDYLINAISFTKVTGGTSTVQYPLDVQANLTDLDGSETLSIKLGGIPSNVTLSAGTKNADGTWTLTPDQLDGLTMNVPANQASDFQLSVSATSTEADGGDAKTTTLQIDVAATDVVASAPVLQVQAASGYEDKAIALDIAAALADTDGSETLSVTISGVPEGATLSAGTHNADGTWSLTKSQLSGLTITPADDSSTDFSLTVVAESTESLGGATSTTTATIPVTVAGVADLPELSVSSSLMATNYAAVPVSLNTTVLNAIEPGYTVTISNVPTGAVLSAGTDNGDGTWTVPGSAAGTLTITPPANYAGSLNLGAAVVNPNGGSHTEISTNFNYGSSGFCYEDGVFGGSGYTSKADGEWDDDAGVYGNGGLELKLGGDDHNGTMSGGFSKQFTTSGTGTGTLTFKYKVDADDIESSSDEYARVMVAINGDTKGTNGHSYVASISGYETGWITVTVDLGMLSAGTNTLTIGGLLTEADNDNDDVQIYFDDLSLNVTGSPADVASQSGIHPDLSVVSVTYDLDIAASLADASGESLQVQLGDIPSGVTLNHGTLADGVWTVTTSDLDDLTMTVPQDTPAFELSVSAQSTDSDGNDVAVITKTVDYSDHLGLAGDDALTGTSDADTVYGGAGNDTITANAGADTIWAGSGNDTVNAGDGNDIVHGGAGTDLLYGGSGNDYMLGGQGSDIIYGDAGNDIIIGGEGNDTLYGGEGADTFVFNLGDGMDTVMGFQDGDQLTFNGISLNDGDQVGITANGDDVVITIIGQDGTQGSEVTLHDAAAGMSDIQKEHISDGYSITDTGDGVTVVVDQNS